MTSRARALVALFCLSAPVLPLAAQSLPVYAPLNPMAQMRSGLTTLPRVSPEKAWHGSVTIDYGNAIEYTDGQTVRYVLDAELLNARFLVTRNIGHRGFLLGETSLHGSYDGFLDGFLDWYHDLTGLHVAARSLRPRDEFDYELGIGEEEFRYQTARYLGDIRVGGGVRFGRGWQSGVWITLPTSGASNGYRMGAVSFNGNLMLHRDFGAHQRFTYEGSVGLGVTPRHGELEPWQRTAFFMVSQGLRARVAGPFHAYANLFYDTPYYRDTGTPELDKKELTLDAGALFRFGRGPAWLLGMTQDLSPSGPAIDVAFRLGVYW